jgi:hypothetical protein
VHKAGDIVFSGAKDGTVRVWAYDVRLIFACQTGFLVLNIMELLFLNLLCDEMHAGGSTLVAIFRQRTKNLSWVSARDFHAVRPRSTELWKFLRYSSYF